MALSQSNPRRVVKEYRRVALLVLVPATLPQVSRDPEDDVILACGVLDDNNRKPVCRLRFNNLQKLSLGLFNDKKEEEKVALSHLDDLYKYAEQLKATISFHIPQEAPGA